MKWNLVNMGSLKLWNFETKKPWNFETKKPRNQDAKKPRHQDTLKTCNLGNHPTPQHTDSHPYTRLQQHFFRNFEHLSAHMSIGGWGVRPTVKSFRFVSFVCACVRAVWVPSGIRTQCCSLPFPFSLFGLESFPFPLCVKCMKCV